MDKITRMLFLYSKLIRGETVNKVSFCMETESNERSFDRDIEDMRLYLSESFSTEEVIYDRANNVYFLSGVAKQDLEMIEYRFLEKLLIQSELLQKDELVGLLTILASNTTKPKECLKAISVHTENYPSSVSTPLLKMHDDILSMIISRSVIEIKYHERKGTINDYEIIPYDVVFSDGHMYLKAFDANSDSRITRVYMLERIESFVKKNKIVPRDILMIEETRVKNANSSDSQYITVIIECTNGFSDLLRKQYKDAVYFTDDGLRATVYCIKQQFIEWILGQPVNDYEIISPNEVNEEISKKVIELFQKYRKEY